MAGAACKIIINNGVRAFAEGLERVLMSPLVRGPMLDPESCDKLISRMADIDIMYYSGLESVPGHESKPWLAHGLVGIAKSLESAGVLTEDVWGVFRPTYIESSDIPPWKDIIDERR